jgi:YggT family protein
VLILVCQLLNLFVIALIARIILSYFPISPGSAMSTVYGVLYSVTEPVLGPVRRVMPSIGILDISPIVVILGVNILQRILCG